MEMTVSIILPVYNVENYLDRCVETLVNQTYKALEIIMVDDGSTDGCPELCDLWAKRDPRIRVLHCANGGLSAARNRGMDASTGEWLMFVDSDDYLPQDAVEVLLRALLEQDTDMAIGKFCSVYPDGSRDEGSCDFMCECRLSGNAYFAAMGADWHYPVNAWGKLFRRSVLEGIRFPEKRWAEDLWVLPDVLERCGAVSVVDQVVYFYYQRENSIVHTKTDVQLSDDIRGCLRLSERFLNRGDCSGAGKWYGAAVLYLQEMKDLHQGVLLVKSLFDRERIRTLLPHCRKSIRVKWFLLQHLWLYRLIFGTKRALFAVIPTK